MPTKTFDLLYLPKSYHARGTGVPFAYAITLPIASIKYPLDFGRTLVHP